MRVAVVDAAGAPLAQSRDLLALQHEYAGGGPAVSAAAPDAADARGWQARGLARFTPPQLPERVEAGQGGFALELYPAFVDASGRVDLTLLPPGPVAAERHRRGVRRLYVLALPQQAAFVRDRVRGDRAMLLAFHGIGTEAELVDDVLLAAAEECFGADDLVRTQAEFDRRLDQRRAAFVPAAERLLEQLSGSLSEYRALKRRLDAPAVPLPDAARADIEAQLGQLIRPYMLSETPVPWRAHLRRYLSAIGVRLDKLEQRHPKDAESQARVEAARARFDAWRAQQPPEWPLPESVQRYVWLIEEFRVSLFAQQLGTVQPVSEKRLEQAWNDALEKSRD